MGATVPLWVLATVRVESIVVMDMRLRLLLWSGGQRTARPRQTRSASELRGGLRGNGRSKRSRRHSSPGQGSGDIPGLIQVRECRRRKFRGRLWCLRRVGGEAW